MRRVRSTDSRCAISRDRSRSRSAGVSNFRQNQGLAFALTGMPSRDCASPERMAFLELKWPFGRATVRPSAAMLWDCEFRLGSGRHFAPLARASWAADDLADPTLPAHM